MKQLLALLPKKERVLIYISWSVKIAVLIAFITAVFSNRIFVAALSLLALVLSFLPAMIEKQFRLILPPEFETLLALFLYASLVLGEFQDYYTRFHWWDLLLHSLSALMIGLIGFMIIYALYRYHKVVFSPVFAAVFAFSFAMAIGAVWEIFEFSMDHFFALNMQKSGLVDTMTDLIVDAIGALITSISGYFYLRGGDSLLIERFVKKFIDLNERLFHKKKGFV